MVNKMEVGELFDDDVLLNGLAQLRHIYYRAGLQWNGPSVVPSTVCA